MIEKTFGNRISGILYTRRPGVYGLIINDNNKLGLIKTPQGYFLPGGGVKQNESVHKALKREISEETGYDAKIRKYIGGYRQFKISFDKSQHYELIGYIFTCELLEKMDCKIETDHQLIWEDIHLAVEKLELEYQRYAVNNYFKRNRIKALR